MLFKLIVKIALKISNEQTIKTMIGFIQNHIKKYSDAEIRYLFNYETLKKLSDAYCCRASFGELNENDEYLATLSEIAEYIWLKDETPISKSSIMDALVTQIKNGTSLEELQNKSKWDLISDVHDIIGY